MNIYIKKIGVCDCISFCRRCLEIKVRCKTSETDNLQGFNSWVTGKHTAPKSRLIPPHPSHFLLGKLKAIVIGFPLSRCANNRRVTVLFP